MSKESKSLQALKNRSQIELADTWNLQDLYTHVQDFKKSKDKFKKEMTELSNYQGRVCQSAQSLRDTLSLFFSLSKTLARLHSYASMMHDQDTRDTSASSMEQEIAQIGSAFSSLASFIEPELLSCDPCVIDDFLKTEKSLGDYQFYIHDVLRRKKHTLSAAEEKIIAEAGLLSDTAHKIYSVFSNADFDYPKVDLSEQKQVKLDPATFAYARTLKNRQDRKTVFSSFFSSLHQYRRTFGTALYSEIKKNMFYQRVRGYSSCLHAALDTHNIPVEVYHTHIDNTRAHLPVFHRYLKLRARLLNVTELHYYDLYAPLVAHVQQNYTIQEAQKHVLHSLEPLGKDYIQVIKRAFNERWIDMYPTEGKRSGAYSNGAAYDVHPYILMNYKGQYDDVSTLTHELGHTMQSYLSNKKQPYATANYPIFVAEVASTLNEALLIEYMLKNVTDRSVRLSLLGHYLEGIKGTVFRQTQFAEFELKIHTIVEQQEALSGDDLDDIYMDIAKNYYGHDLGICVVDDDVQSEWAYIPHFYYQFYVYQYATSYTASAALSESILLGNQNATQKYLDFLSAGGSQYPIDLLKDAGVDMLSEKPMQLTMQKMNRIMDEIEKIL